MSAIPAGYKRTEAGVIPEEWEVKALGGFVSLQRGNDLTERDRRPGSVPVIGSAGQNGFHDTALVKGPGVVVGRSGASFGQAHFCMADFWPHNTGLYVTDFHGNDRLFAFYFLRSFDFSRHNSGGAQQSLNRNFIAPIPVCIPPLTEQEAIAEALSDADALIESLEQLLIKKRHLKQAAMQELLTDKKRLPGFSGDWAVKTIEELENARLMKLSRGKVISKKEIERVPGDFPIYSSSVIGGGLFGHYGDFMFNEELITWSVDGGGHFFHRRKHKFSVTNVCGYMRVEGSKLCYPFVAAQLQLLHSRMKFDYQDKAHPSIIRKAYFVSFPLLNEQVAIAAVLSDFDDEIADLEAQLTKNRLLKQGMMQKLLTGEIRLP